MSENNFYLEILDYGIETTDAARLCCFMTMGRS